MGNRNSNEANQFLINVRGRVTEDTKAQIVTAVGVDLGPYMRLPDYPTAFLVWASKDQAEAAKHLACVSKVGVYEGKYKAGNLRIEDVADDEPIDLVVKIDHAHTTEQVLAEWEDEGAEHHASSVAACGDDKIAITVPGRYVADFVTWLRSEPHCHYIERKARYRL
ncbi:uncharacterized protein AMSG_05739 [Thecamonas trahens ATCC 50062]|uniref:Uncharacterized protein n=1 Tax=Thecamonas trahens ATCC 50062 TaxID=461836 RepID=A0A0L0DF92_THETB|nr:hypothetical protein AMSG_05739 [Thecamonas trahens ATCC 50062]KNC49983.1 hypothetical protein AMSG_05739 [Thecamonas trahens ATCC 50062]|eukprot:XP_013757152.1 hypothetical protein AMSG_05739 [Thecamonas trahens ATCC 50062]